MFSPGLTFPPRVGGVQLGPTPLSKGVGDPTLLWDEDFVNGVYRYNRVRYPAITDLPMTTFTRATGGYGVTAAGALVWFGAGALRTTDAGLTVEAAATNLLTYSDDYANAAWIKLTDGTGITPAVETDAVPGPFAGTADRVTFDLASGTGFNDYSLLYRDVNTGAGQFSRAVWLRSTTPSTILFADGLSEYEACTVTAAWTRFDLTSTLGSSGNFQIGLRGTFGSSDSATVEIWNSTLESGPIVTSDIVTTSAAATRNADVLVTADSVISPTIVAEFTVPSNGGATPFPWVWGWDDGTGSNRVMLVLNRSNMNLRLQIDTGGVAQAYVDLGTLVAGSTYKIAARLAANDVAVSKNGAAVVTDTSVTLPVVSTFRRGRGPSGNEWGPGIRKIKRYSTAKTNAELQALST